MTAPAIPPTGWITPVSLFASITETSNVSGERAFIKCFRVDDALPVYRHVGDAVAFGPQLLAGLQYGRVLDCGNDYMPPDMVRTCRTRKRQIVAFSGAGSNYELIAAISSEGPCQFGLLGLKYPCNAAYVSDSRCGIRKLLRQIRDHRIRPYSRRHAS